MGGVAQRVGQVGGAAGELAHLDLADQLGALLGQPSPDGLDVEAVLLTYAGGPVDLALSSAPFRAERVQPGRLPAHHPVVRRPVGQLEPVGGARRLVGQDQLLAGVDSREHGRGDLLGPERRLRDQSADHLADGGVPLQACMFSIRPVRK